MSNLIRSLFSRKPITAIDTDLWRSQRQEMYRQLYGNRQCEKLDGSADLDNSEKPVRDPYTADALRYW